MASDGVADHLDEHVHVEVVELREQPGLRERVAHQRPGDRGVEAALHAVLELVPMEREEVRALLALDVDDLDVLAGLDLVGEGRRAVDAEVEPRLGERGRELELVVRARARPAHLHVEVGRRDTSLQHGRALGRRDHHDDRALRDEGLGRAGRRPLPEEPERGRLGGVQATGRERRDHIDRSARVRPEQRPEDRGGCIRRPADGGGVVGAVRRQRGELRGLTRHRDRARSAGRRRPGRSPWLLPGAPSTARGTGPRGAVPGR